MVSLFHLGYELAVAGAGSVKLWEAFGNLRGEGEGAGRHSHWAPCSNNTKDGLGYMIGLGKRLRDEGLKNRRKNRSPIHPERKRKALGRWITTTLLLADVCVALAGFLHRPTKRYRGRVIEIQLSLLAVFKSKSIGRLARAL